MVRIDDFQWDDIRIFLAIMRAPSLRQAAEELGVSRPTVGRRLDGLEESLGLQLFDRRSDGLHATAEAITFADAAEEVERAMLALGRVAQAADPELQGRVHVTLPAALATDLLMPDFVAFGQRWPQIELHIESSSSIVDLGQRQADVAIRIMPVGQQPEEDLAGRKAATLYRAVYGTGDSWIGWKNGPKTLSRSGTNDFPNLPIRNLLKDVPLQRSACAAGMGLARLPCFYAEPLLTRRTDPEPGGEAWVLVHPDLRRNPRLRVFRDAIVVAFKRHRSRLRGVACGS